VAKSEAMVRASDVDECCSPRLVSPLDDGRAALLARRFAALADPARLKIVAMLATADHGEVCVCDFVEPLGKSQPTVSHHLKVLSDAGLVAHERRGKWAWYSIRPEHLPTLRATIEGWLAAKHEPADG
jgi:ArsR family transcriptional regulator